MAECPGALELAAMADGGLARLRVPGGRLTSAQARAVASAARQLGSGIIDLTSRANLQIRGLRHDGGPAFRDALASAGLLVEGPADRRRNILLDPLAGLDPSERRDLTPLAAALAAALQAAPWIGDLSPKFSFALDGGGAAGVSAIASDVAVLATEAGVRMSFGALAFEIAEPAAVELLTAVARAAAVVGPRARARDIPAARADELARDAGARIIATGEKPTLVPAFGPVRSRDGRAALVLPVPLGRLDPDRLGWVADVAEAEGDGSMRLAPWSAICVPGVDPAKADAVLRCSEAFGFPPVEVARRLSVAACAGAPSCERAREPAKALGLEILRLASAEPELLPDAPKRLHLSACPKGCAGGAVSDLLLLGATAGAGWTLHRDAAPRAPGAALEPLAAAEPRAILRRLRSLG